MLTHRRSLALLAFVVVASVAASPAESRGSPPTPARQTSSDPHVGRQTAGVVVELVAPSFDSIASELTMIRHAKVSKVEIAAGVSVVQLSDRTREQLQVTAVRQAIGQAVRSGDVSPGTLNREIIDAMVDEFGSDTAETIAKSYRPSPDAYRVVLRRIRDRSFDSSRGRS